MQERYHQPPQRNRATPQQYNMQEQYHTSNSMKTKYPYINKPSPTYESYISDISSSEDFQYPQHKNTSKDPWKVENDTYNRSFQAQKERFERNHIAPHTKITDPWQSKKRDVLDFDNRSTKQQNISAKDRRKGIIFRFIQLGKF